MASEAKERRLTFAAGYSDAWSKRSSKSDEGEEYDRGYSEGTTDRARADEERRTRRR